jgi:hypothetical protein
LPPYPFLKQSIRKGAHNIHDERKKYFDEMLIDYLDSNKEREETIEKDSILDERVHCARCSSCQLAELPHLNSIESK